MHIGALLVCQYVNLTEGGHIVSAKSVHCRAKSVRARFILDRGHC